MLLYWLWLASRPEVGDGLKAALLRHFGDPEDLFFASKEEIAESEIQGLNEQNLAALCDRDLSGAEKILSDCSRLGISVLPFGDSAYPKRLQAIYDPPTVLYYKGRLPDFDHLAAIGVVGTRKASLYGIQAAKRIGKEIAEQGGLVVSGLADGIDGAAMGAALGLGLPAVGVLGCGADVVYPRQNRELFAQTERLGCILSEFAPGTPPVKWNFPKRNRIISGLSCGVAVIEAPERSGSLLTARHALEQGRDVFVVPGNVDMESFVGSNRLLRSGAIAVSSGLDIMAEYEGLYTGKLSGSGAAQAPVPPENRPEKNAPIPKIPQKTIDNGPSRPYSEQNDPFAGLSLDEKAVLAAVGEAPTAVDEIIAAAGLPSGRVLGILTVLEIRKKILRHPGKRVSRQR